ncbi:hypothetical protein NKY40_27430, partial [Sinorhizobium meliloti]|uniref:hypothetical protein n=1 Tax=Rhizobium meliloti TaxID=382 RepID=UPI003D64D470
PILRGTFVENPAPQAVRLQAGFFATRHRNMGCPKGFAQIAHCRRLFPCKGGNPLLRKNPWH